MCIRKPVLKLVHEKKGNLLLIPWNQYFFVFQIQLIAIVHFPGDTVKIKWTCVKYAYLVDNQRSAMSALAGQVSFLFLLLAIEPLIAFSRTGQDVRHSTSTRCAGLNGLEGRIQLLIFLKVGNVGLNVFLIICWYLFLLLLIPCGFHIIHSDPTYLSMPWHLPSALANLPQTQNQI